MTPLPAALGGVELVAWRIDRDIYRQAWDSGEGAYLAGGRWNSKGVRAVYCSLDPATAILEVAVHKSFRILDLLPHTLTSIVIDRPDDAHVVFPESVPNPEWLRSGIPTTEQQQFGDDLLSRYRYVIIPSAVSVFSWNLVFLGASAAESHRLKSQVSFVLDKRLHSAAP